MLIKENTSLEEAWSDLKHELHRGALDRKSPLHQFILATQAPDEPDACYVVLRAVSRDLQPEFYTDYRSAKVQHLQVQPKVCALFYHPRQRFQLRLYARAALHHQDDVTAERWKQVPSRGRKAYTPAIPPGEFIAQPADAYHWPDEDDPQNFTVVQLEPYRWDLLQLDGDAHRRVFFTRKGENWQGQWVAP